MNSDPFIWLVPWEPSIAVVTCTVLASLFYLRGCMRLRQKPLRQLFFWLGVGGMYGAAHTQFDYYSEHAFFMHRLQHSILHHSGPFFIALSRPGAVLAAGMPQRLKGLLHKILRWRPAALLIDFLNNAAVATVIFCGLIMLWMIPAVHFISMLDWRWYRVMNWSVTINGLMFWNLALNNYCLRRAHLSPGVRIIMMLAVIPLQIAVGIVLFVTPYEIYPIYSMCGPAFDISPLTDQRMGGIILWIHAGMMSVIGMLVVMRRQWMTR